MVATSWSWFTRFYYDACYEFLEKNLGSCGGWSRRCCRSSGFCTVALGCVFALHRFHHRRRCGFCFFHLDGQMTQHGIIELECGFQLDQGLVVAFDVQADVVRFWQLLDLVSHLTAAPVFDAMDVTAAAGHRGLVTFDHRRDLLALVRVDDKNDFIMTHA